MIGDDIAEGMAEQKEDSEPHPAVADTLGRSYHGGGSQADGADTRIVVVDLPLMPVDFCQVAGQQLAVWWRSSRE